MTRRVNRVREYDMWTNMLGRCRNEKWRNSFAYKDATISENFKSYTFFYEWCQSQIGFGNKDEKGYYWQLDKDILVVGNKLYSEDTCCFVPRVINNACITKESCRGKYLLGVSQPKNGKRFVSQCNDGTKLRYLGYFDTEQEAFETYKTFKESYIKQLADEYKDQLDVRVYASLLSYTVLG